MLAKINHARVLNNALDVEVYIGNNEFCGCGWCPAA
jgi:hypothetical protein